MIKWFSAIEPLPHKYTETPYDRTIERRPYIDRMDTMDWVGATHYGVILQRERLQRAAEPGATLNVTWLSRWLSALRKAVTVRYCTFRNIPAQECFA